MASESSAAIADVTFVIPQHGCSELTIACVRSLRRHETARRPVIVIDDGSSQGERAALRESLPDVSLHEQPHRGVTAAWNAGLRRVQTAFVVLLNNDTVTQGPWVEALVRPLRTGRARMTGAAWRTERGVPPETLIRLSTATFLEGWCLAAPVSVLLDAGGFDESLQIYFSDTDLQARIVHRYGADCRATVDEVRRALRHRGHASTRLLPERRKIWEADRARFTSKWRGD